MTDILLKIKNSVAEKRKTAVAQSDLQKWGLKGNVTQAGNFKPLTLRCLHSFRTDKVS